jgi:hypothetical protein
LIAGKANTIYLLEVPDGGPGTRRDGPKYDLEKRKLDKLVDGVANFRVSQMARRCFTGRAAGSFSRRPGPKPGGRLKIAEMDVYVDPKAEWQQMYNEAWRFEETSFDPGPCMASTAEFKRNYQPIWQASVIEAISTTCLLKSSISSRWDMFLGEGTFRIRTAFREVSWAATIRLRMVAIALPASIAVRTESVCGLR